MVWRYCSKSDLQTLFYFTNDWLGLAHGPCIHGGRSKIHLQHPPWLESLGGQNWLYFLAFPISRDGHVTQFCPIDIRRNFLDEFLEVFTSCLQEADLVGSIFLFLFSWRRLWFLLMALLSSWGTIKGAYKGLIFTLLNQSRKELSESQSLTCSYLRISLLTPHQTSSFVQPSVTESHNWSEFEEQVVPSLSWYNHNTISIHNSQGIVLGEELERL